MAGFAIKPAKGKTLAKVVLTCFNCGHPLVKEGSEYWHAWTNKRANGEVRTYRSPTCYQLKHKRTCYCTKPITEERLKEAGII